MCVSTEKQIWCTTEDRNMYPEWRMRILSTHTEAGVKCIPTKLRTKSRVPWETLAVREKRADMKTASKCNRKNPTNTNALKLKQSTKWISKHISKRTNRIHTKSDKIRDSAEDRQSRIAWQTKWAEGRAQPKQNWKLQTNKKEYNCGNSISRIYKENHRKLHMNQSQELLVSN